MTRIELINFFYNKKILGEDKKRKRFNWKTNWDNECESELTKFSASYRSRDEAWFCLIHNIEPHICEVCGKISKFTGSTKSKILGYNTTCEFCSPNAVKEKNVIIQEKIKNRSIEEKQKSKEKRKKTCLERYGEENYGLFGSKSFKQNLKEKYGDENYNNRNLAKKTMLEKYGVEHNFQINASKRSKRIWDEHKETILCKREQTCLEKYGYKEYVLSDDFKKKSTKTIIKNFGSIENAINHKTRKGIKTKLLRYGDETYHNKEQGIKTIENNHKEFEIKNNCLRYTKVIKLYGQGWKALNIPIIYNKRYRYISNVYIPQIKQYSEEEHNISVTSKQENELYEFIKGAIGDKYRIYRNTQKIIRDNKQKYELDIYIPKIKLAFEYNGDYWHSSLNKPKYYHQIKTKLCYEMGIQLIHIYEHDWVYNKDFIKKNIINLLNGNDCSKLNWISVKDYDKYILSEPEKIIINNLEIYNEGKFINKTNYEEINR